MDYTPTQDDDLTARFYIKDPDSGALEHCETFYETDRRPGGYRWVPRWLARQDGVGGRRRATHPPDTSRVRATLGVPANAGRYQRPSVDAGEELRWLPRRLVSALPLPGNDCFVLDDCVMFNVIGGNDEPVDIQLSREPDVMKFCRDSFESAWEIATPHREFEPA